MVPLECPEGYEFPTSKKLNMEHKYELCLFFKSIIEEIMKGDGLTTAGHRFAFYKQHKQFLN